MHDVDTVYSVPILLNKQKVDKTIIEKLKIKAKQPNLNDWKRVVKAKLMPEKEVNVSFVGKYTELKDSYKSINEALEHAGIKNKAKEDVPVTEAFELYMLKNFHQIELNPLTSKMLNFWEKDFEQSIEKHKKFLQDNLENQNNYSSRFSQILEEMDIFQSEEDDEKKEENQDQGQDNPSNDDQNKDAEDSWGDEDENDEKYWFTKDKINKIKMVIDKSLVEKAVQVLHEEFELDK